jgi:hypothetical protein
VRASSSAGLSVCWLKPPDDARILPNLKFVAINQLLSPLTASGWSSHVTISGGPTMLLRPSSPLPELKLGGLSWQYVAQRYFG